MTRSARDGTGPPQYTDRNTPPHSFHTRFCCGARRREQLARQRKGIEDRLPPGRTAGLGHDRGDHIGKLGETGAFTRSAWLSSEMMRRRTPAHPRPNSLLKDRRCDRPSAPDAVLEGAAGPVPDIPFVEAQHDLLGGATLGGDGVGDGDHPLDKGVNEVGAREEGRRIVFLVVQVGVQARSTRRGRRCARAPSPPSAKGRHRSVPRSRRRRVRSSGPTQLHRLRRFGGDAAVFLRGFRPPSARARPSRCRDTRI